MNKYRAFVVLSVLVAGFLAASQTSEGAPAAPAIVGNAVAGKETFTQYCSVCHGVAAKGFIGPSIAGVNWTTVGLHAIVRGGLGGYGSMPAFNAAAVTDKDVADIAAFLAALAPTVSPASSTTAAPGTPSVTRAPAIAVAPSPAAIAPQPASPASGDPIHGHQIYTANCSACHGATGQGGVGPNLHGEKARKDTAAAIAWIKNPTLPMPKLYPSLLSEKDVDDVAAYVESL